MGYATSETWRYILKVSTTGSDPSRTHRFTSQDLTGRCTLGDINNLGFEPSRTSQISSPGLLLSSYSSPSGAVEGSRRGSSLSDGRLGP